MVAGGRSLFALRLKREDHNKTRHDGVFTEWKVLIGPSDWEDHSNGKEGVARYRVHNLPNRSCPGLYELGAAMVRFGSGNGTDRLDADHVIVAYLGQADSVRSRLQCYGRSGSHLGKNETCDLFEQIFSRGCSIVFRWAPMETKKRAEETEAQLLDTFDYAWNTGRNGVRRQDDVLEKISKITSKANRFATIKSMLRPFTQKQVGIRIKGNKLVLEENKFSNNSSQEESHNFLSALFKISRSRPKLVLNKSEDNLGSGLVCGVTLRDGSCCTRPSVQGRKRCMDHKGKKIHGFDVKSTTNNNWPHLPHVHSVSNPADGLKSSTKCGIALRNGEICERMPVSGRKRCEEHKGMKVKALLPKSAAKAKSLQTSDSYEGLNNGIASITLNAQKLQQEEDFSSLCGATLRDGSICRRKPGKGNKVCWQH